MSRTPQPLDEVDDTENMMHQQCHVMRQSPPYHREIWYPYMSLTGAGTTL
jgi:hypothetical protein